MGLIDRPSATSHDAGARERILETAYELFSRRGTRGVGVEEVIARAGVAKATLYRHFASKDDLVIAVLQLREERWTLGWVDAEARARGASPEEHLLAMFDLFDEWFHRKDFEATVFINVVLELGRENPVSEASIRHLENMRGVVRRLAEEAGLRDTESFARSWHILVQGSIVAAAEGDTDAAKRAQAMAKVLIGEHRRSGNSQTSSI